jgi:hypothetical protein
MSKTQVSDRDRPDLERLEQMVKDAGHDGIGTAALSKKSGTKPERIRNLFNSHSFRVSKTVASDSKANVPADIWVYKPTPDDISAPHRAK